MCGRFNLRTPVPDLLDLFEAAGDLPDVTARYNIAPTQDVVIVRPSQQGPRELVQVRWGLVPSWSKKPTSTMINARAETAASKPAFRAAFKRRRCLIPADNFYEWKREGKSKQPYAIGLTSDESFAMAGLWEVWKRDEDDWLESCTILTTAANERIGELHDRMPVILPPDRYADWLDPEADNESLQKLLVPLPDEQIKLFPVSSYVNNARHEGPECMEPVEANGAD